MNIKKGDNVIVITGADKGKKGKVIKSFPELNKIIVEGISIHKKHQRPRKSNEKGQTISIPGKINVSNVMVVDPKTGKPTRIGKKLVGEKMVRVSVKSKAEL